MAHLFPVALLGCAALLGLRDHQYLAAAVGAMALFAWATLVEEETKRVRRG